MQFTVRSLTDADHYVRQFGDGTIDALDSKVRLVVVLCRVRNGTAKTINICTVGGGKTALADLDEHTYEVFTGDGPRNADILPGSVIDFGWCSGYRKLKSSRLSSTKRTASLTRGSFA